jgi:hemerythrin superfamily protein
VCLFNPFQEIRMTRFMDAVTPTATNLIRTDHTAVIGYFHKLEPSVQGKVRSAIVRNLCTALEIHAQMEEELFYPALRSAGLSSPELEQSVPAHDEVRRLIDRVRSLEENSDQQCEAVNELMGAVMHHVADEETKLLPMAEQQMSPEVLSELGTRMTRRRLELTKPHATEMAVDMAVGAPMKTAVMAAGTLVAGALLYNRLRRPSGNGMSSSASRRYAQGR